ncbi:ribonuclease D [Lishizhenia tianjinensis]|uniref:Ribonuclease D n=1 Tax=Lishizhenia tianjinensis TaxID=477690 RepID=A0A1I7B049_9FLAO|nr:ribonuclease D [Lishizhenia tianjinensis]SFT80556.1 ribonuclease D [Lishizhenia tianjinensis]
MQIQYITKQEELDQCVQAIANEPSIAVDLEFDKNHYRYGFNLCLIQIYDHKTCYLIDPLAKEISLEGLFDVFRDPAVEKLVFAFGEDIRLLHHLGCKAQNILDLANVRSLLNYPPSSLSNMLAEVLGMETDKKLQKSNWFKRPLSEEQIKYAADDVLYLFPLKDALMQQAEALGRLDWIAQENAIFNTAEFIDNSEEINVKLKDKKMLNAFEWFIVEGLLIWREKLAKAVNKPSYQIMHKDLIWDLALGNKYVEDFMKFRGVYRKIQTPNCQRDLENRMEELYELAHKKQISKSKPAVAPLNPEEKAKNKELRAIVDEQKNNYFGPIKEAIAEKYGKEFSAFVLSNTLISQIALQKATDLLPYKKEIINQEAANLGLTIRL